MAPRFLVIGKDTSDRYGLRAHHLFFSKDICDTARTEKEGIGRFEEGGYDNLFYVAKKPRKRLALKHASKIRTFQAPEVRISPWKLDARLAKFFKIRGLRAILLFPIRLLILITCWCFKAFGRHVMLATMSARRLGHLSYNTHVLLTKAAGFKRPMLFIVYTPGITCNEQLMAMYRRIVALSVISKYLYGLLDCPLLRRSPFFYDTAFFGDVHEPLHTLNNDAVYLRFTDEEELIGQQLLRDMGVPAGAEFVCIHARDSQYLDEVFTRRDPEGWNYHNFRDCDIETYREAAQYLTSQGLYVFRMGAVVDKHFPARGNDRIIDYATDYRSDFMDIYLLAKCKFLLGSCCGVTQASTVFGRPVAVANWTHIEFSTCFRPGDIMLPKLAVSDRFGFASKEEAVAWKTEGIIPLRQILASGAGRFTEAEQYQDAGITLVDNTPEQIRALAVEMNSMIDAGGFTEAQVMKNRQFRSIMHDKNYVCNGTMVSLSEAFGDKYPEWLL